jgi:hypothetical protein
MSEEIQVGGIEPVTKTDILALATWNRERSREELIGFIASRELAMRDILDDDA